METKESPAMLERLLEMVLAEGGDTADRATMARRRKKEQGRPKITAKKGKKRKRAA